MTLEELRNSVEEDTLNTDLIIFRCKQDFWLADQWVNAIASSKLLKIINCESIYEAVNSPLAFLEVVHDKLYVLRTDIFEERSDDYDQFENTIVICHKVDKKLESELADFIIDVDSIEEWAIKTYMHQQSPMLTEDYINWLYEATRGNIYRIENELAKVNLFQEKEEQEQFFEALKTDRSSGLYAFDNLTMSDAILKKDLQAISNQLYYKDSLVVDPIAVVNICLNRLKLYLLAKYHRGADGKGLSYLDLGLKKSGQLYYIKREAAIYDEKELQRKINFLSSIDLRLKSNRLSLKPNQLLNYIIVKMAY